jgi:hypothetical protein
MKRQNTKNTRCWLRLREVQTLNLNREINTHQTGAHQAPVSNAERRDTGPDSALIPGCRLGLALDVMLMGIGRLIALDPGGGPGQTLAPVPTS